MNRPESAPAARVVIVSTGVATGVVALVVWQRHRLSDLPTVLGNAHWVWIAAAVLVQGLSVASLARMHRILLGATGRRTGIRSILATTYAGNAISQSLPVVGSAVSTVFVYRRYLALGVEKISAAWVLMVSGVYSTLSFVALSAAGALITGAVAPAVAGSVTLLAGVIPAVVLLAGLRRSGVRVVLVRVLEVALTLVHGMRHARDHHALIEAGQIIDQVASLRVGPGRALGAGFYAVLNWSSDVACLVLALMSIGAPVPWHGVLLAWAAGAGASSLGLTPGGLGVVESTLSIALIAAGLPAALAVSGVLLYRFITLWLVIAAGAVTLLVIRAKARLRTLPTQGAVVDRSGAALMQSSELAAENAA